MEDDFTQTKSGMDFAIRRSPRWITKNEKSKAHVKAFTEKNRKSDKKIEKVEEIGEKENQGIKIVVDVLIHPSVCDKVYKVTKVVTK